MKNLPDRKNCWGVTDRIKDVRLFFVALNSFTEHGLILYIDAARTSKPIYDLLQRYKIQTSEDIGIGALNPKPDQLFHIPLSERFLYDLTTLMMRQKFYVTQVALYKDMDIVFCFHDAFMRNSDIDISQELGIRNS